MGGVQAFSPGCDIVSARVARGARKASPDFETIATFFVGGAAFGAGIQLTREPIFLRFAYMPGCSDTLRALEDGRYKAEDGEIVIASRWHSGKNYWQSKETGGRRLVRFVEYEALADQPDDCNVLRYWSLFREWCKSIAGPTYG